ncbi:MAG: glycosyltransferase [Candidatus Woesearchaeota archaeon]
MNATAGELIMYVTAYFGLFTSIFFLITLIENKNKLKNPVPKKTLSASIIVPAYNEEKTLAKTIKSLLALNYPKDKLEIIVVDDGSTDKTLEIANMIASKKENKFPVKVLTKENGGKGQALNISIKQAKGELVGALDADSFVHPDALYNIIGHFNEKKVMAVTPSMKVHEPKNILQKVQAMEFLLGIFLRKVFGLLDSIHVTPGPFTIYRKEFFNKYGGYDENNITEDIEIALRIQSLGFKIRNSVDAFVHTSSPSKFMPLMNQRIRWYRGFMDNVINYKQLFGPKHGNLGMFILPASLVSVALVILSVGYTLFSMARSNFKMIKNWYNVDFDLLKMIKFDFDFFFFDGSSLVFIGLLAFALGIVVIYNAKKISLENKSIKVSYAYFLIFYLPLFAFWWSMAIYYKTFNKKIKWAGKSL